MQNFISVGISLPREIVDKIDNERGDISRSKFVFRLLERLYSASYDKNKASANSSSNNKRDPPDPRFLGLSSDESRFQ